MDARQLRYFVAIFEQRNLSRAAERCNVAQSALSRHVGQLEDELGVTLFVREPRGMRPTAAGIRLYDHARPILRSMEAAKEDLKLQSEELAGDIAVGMPYSVVEALALPLLQRVAAKSANIRFSLVEGHSTDTFEMLCSMGIELALFYNPVSDARVAMKPLLEEEVLCIGAKEVLGSAEAPIRFSEVCKLPVILLREGAFARSTLDRSHLLAQLRDQSPFGINSLNAMAKALAAGLGCTLGSRVTFREQLAAGRLCARPIIEPKLTRTLYMGQLADRPPTRLLEYTAHTIKALAKEEVVAGRWDAKLAGE